MKKVCPGCKSILDIDDEYIGYEYPCPNCGTSIYVTRGARTDPRVALKPSPIQRPDDHQTLCFWLGFIFLLFGLLISAIIGKGRGVIQALYGMIVSALLFAFAYVIYFITATI